MSGYQPGDRVYVTLEMRVDKAGQYRAESGGRLTHFASPEDQAIVRVEPALAELPAGWGARIRATVTCSCGDLESMVPVPGVRLVRVDDGSWRTSGPLPCGCWTVGPEQDGGPDRITDAVVLDPGETP